MDTKQAWDKELSNKSSPAYEGNVTEYKKQVRYLFSQMSKRTYVTDLIR